MARDEDQEGKKKIVLQISKSGKTPKRMRQKLQPLLGARPYETWPSGVESNVEYDEGVSEWIYFGGGGGTPGFFTPVVS